MDLNKNDLISLLKDSPVVPVLAINRIEDAVPLATALVEGGLRVLEVTLRTPAALEAIQAIAEEVDGAVVGSGTVTETTQLDLVYQSGGQFAISPGATPALLKAGKESAIPYIPAISTVSELMVGIDHGYDFFKFFPAEASGGTNFLKSIQGPFPNVTFCPTGGIHPGNCQDYLRLDNVVCIGGSWVVPTDAIESKNWNTIRQLAQEAVRLARFDEMNKHNA